ncbi:MAG: hypothetical protein J6L64_06715 [Opitutales bacterium]|nr:hypothetical protein [Opitutales bacterium]
MKPDLDSDEIYTPQADVPAGARDGVPVVEENGEDPLKRREKFSWKSFGGDGFIVSVIIHAVLILFAFFYVMATVKPEPDPVPTFLSGSGGGGNGENPSKTRQMRPKPREMATQNKIVSKNASSSLTLPEMPKMDTSGSMGGMKAGGPSSGFGDGGNGGGIGPGQGVGIGGGRNFVSGPFGIKHTTLPSLKGTLFDLKRSRDGKITYCTTEADNAGKRKDELHKAIGMLDNSFDVKKLTQRYFEAGTKLNANQVYIYKDFETKNAIRAEAATAAFADEEGKPPFDAPGWLVVYTGDITPPETGEYRFVGMGDDVLIVGLDRKTVFYAYWPGEGHGSAVREPAGSNWEPKNHTKTDGKGSGNGGTVQNHLFKGSWMKLQKGRKYKICIAFGEGAGGYAGAVLGIEKKGERDENSPDAPYSIFKLGPVNPEFLEMLFIEGRYKQEGPNFGTKTSKGRSDPKPGERRFL